MPCVRLQPRRVLALLTDLPTPRCSPQDMKLRYYSLVIALALEEDAFLDACKSYQEVYDTPEIKADEAKSQEVRTHTAHV
jgi:hypothetical protein